MNINNYSLQYIRYIPRFKYIRPKMTKYVWFNSIFYKKLEYRFKLTGISPVNNLNDRSYDKSIIFGSFGEKKEEHLKED